MASLCFKLCGQGVSINSIPADVMGRLLINAQAIIYDIASSSVFDRSIKGRRPDKIKELFRAAIRSVSSGSVVIELSDFQHTKATIYNDELVFDNIVTELDQVISNFEQGIDAIPPDQTQLYTKISGYIGDITQDDKISVHFSACIDKNDMKWHDLKHEGLRKTISLVQQKYVHQSRQKVDGVIARFKLDGPERYICIKTTDGHIIRIDFGLVELSDIFQYIQEVPITITGLVHKCGHKEYFEVVDSIETMKPLNIYHPKLKIKFNVIPSFEFFDEKDFWVANAQELSIDAIGPTLEDAIDDLKDRIETACDIYLLEPDENLTSDAIQLKKKLQALIEKEGHNEGQDN